MINDIKELVAENKIKVALDVLYRFLLSQELSEKYEENLILLTRRLTEIDNKIISGVSTEEQASKELNSISSSILKLISNIDYEINYLKNKLKVPQIGLLLKKVEQNLDTHQVHIAKWASEISFKDSHKTKSLNEVYIDIDITVRPRRLEVEINENEEYEFYKVEDIIGNSKNFVILGDPGAGKTTSLKYTSHVYISNKIKHSKKILLIRLRELDTDEYLYDRIASILGITLDIYNYLKFDKNESYSDTSSSKQQEFRRILNAELSKRNILLILDGMDEVNDYKLKFLKKEINIFIATVENSKICITCRSGSYSFDIENVDVYELCELNADQVKDFSLKWLGSKSESQKFTSQLHDSPYYDTSVRPLVLAHLCALYERYKRIPKKPKSIYKKVIYLLLEEWDAQRGIVRSSRYAEFEIDRKFDFLSSLAYYLNLNFDRKTYTKKDFKIVYDSIYKEFSLSKKEYSKVFQEVEAHNGLIIQSSFDTFEFSHKSLQEYLAAEYLIRLFPPPIKEIIDGNFYEELAIATCLASDATSYFCFMCFDIFTKSTSIRKQSIIKYLTRLRQEKPDFRPSVQLILCLFTLYEKLVINSDNSLENRRLLGDKDEQLKEIFNHFFNLKVFKESLIELKDKIYDGYFEVIHDRDLSSNVELFVDTVHLERSYFDIPRSIYIEEKYLKL